MNIFSDKYVLQYYKIQDTESTDVKPADTKDRLYTSLRRETGSSMLAALEWHAW